MRTGLIILAIAAIIAIVVAVTRKPEPPTPPELFDPWVYDADGNGYIEISEQLDAVADYIDGQITLNQLNQVTALYTGHIYRR